MKIVIDIPYGHYLTIKDGFLNECIKSTTEAIVNGTPLEQMLDNAYEDFGKLKAGDSYIIINGKEHTTDVAYAMDGIELFIDFITGREQEEEE